MRLTVCRAAVAALVLPLAAASCASERYPASPVPAVLSDREAMMLAQLELRDRGGAPPGVFSFAEPTGDGYLVGYKSDFDLSRQPPRESHLVVVKHDGTTRTVTFRQGR